LRSDFNFRDGDGNVNTEISNLAQYRLAELNAVIESIPDAIIIGDFNGIIRCNSHALKLLGFDSLDELKNSYSALYKKINLRSPSNGIPLKLEKYPMIRALNNEKFEERILITNVKTGKDLVLRVAGAPVVLNNRVIAGVVIESDISDRISSEEKLELTLSELHRSHVELHQSSLELKNYASELEDLNDTKDKLFSIIAHDLRAPFQALNSVANILIEELDSLNKDEILIIANELRKTVKTQFEVVDNLLSWVQLQKGSVKFNPRRIFLFDKVKLVLEQLRTLANNKAIRFVNSVPDDLVVIGDMNMLQSVFHNLIFNGIKFCHPGGLIEINAEKSGLEILISVKDDGIGMEHDLIEMLFTINKDVLRDGTLSEKGTGLGLNLCHEMVLKQGGKIWVESDLGKGSTFYFTLPAVNDQLNLDPFL
jgi:signal transduction histidine kinase